MIRSVLEQNPRSFSELLFHCEFRAIASRVVSAVSNFFKQIAHLILEKYCQLENRVVAISDSKKNFIDHLLKIPMDQREAFVRQVFSILSPKVDPNLQDTFIRAMAKKDGHRLVRSIRQHITFDMTTWLNIEIIKIITEVPFQDRELFTDHLRKLKLQEMGWDDKGDIICSIAKIPPNEREQVVQSGLLIARAEMDVNEKIVLIQFLFEVPKDERKLIVDLALKLITEEMNFYDRRDILQSIINIPIDEREQVVQSSLLIAGAKMDVHKKIALIQFLQGILQSITDIPVNEREQVILNSLSLTVGAVMTANRKIALIQFLFEVPKDERQFVVNLALKLITEEMDFHNRIGILQSITDIPVNEREQVILSSLSLIAGSCMNGNDRRVLIGLVYEIPSFLRESTVNFASNLITQEMDLGDRRDILQSVIDIPIEYRSQVISDNLDAINGESDVTKKLHMIRDLSDKVVVESDVEKTPYQSVHNRDQKTREMIELLRAYQKKKDGEDLSEKEIDMAVNSLIAYLSNCEIDSIKREKAQNALLGTQIARNDNSGPLIDKRGFKISGLQVSGKTLVARLWVFTSGLEERERENARVGMVAALSRSYDEFGGRVYNVRKAQELVFSVLQGRLDELSVEGEMVLEQMSKEQIKK